MSKKWLKCQKFRTRFVKTDEFLTNYCSTWLSFLKKVVDRVGRGITLTVPDDQVKDPTLASNLADVTTDLILQEEKGTFHVAGTTPVICFSFQQQRVLRKPVSVILFELRKRVVCASCDLSCTRFDKACYQDYQHRQQAL